jgi:hypothetical protein
MADVRVINSSDMIGLHIMSDEAQQWVSKNIHTDPWQWMGDILWMEATSAEPVMLHMQEDGLALTLQAR